MTPWKCGLIDKPAKKWRVPERDDEEADEAVSRFNIYVRAFMEKAISQPVRQAGLLLLATYFPA